MDIWINNLYAFTKKKTGYLLTNLSPFPKRVPFPFWIYVTNKKGWWPSGKIIQILFFEPICIVIISLLPQILP